MATIVVGTVGGLYEGAYDEPTAFAGGSVDALSPDGTWAIVDGTELWRRDRGWSLAARTEGPYLTCVLPFEDRAIVGTRESHLLRYDGRALDRIDAFENVEGRDRWFTPWGGPPDVRSLAASPAGEVYVNVHVGGIVKGDGDQTWEPTIDISVDVHEIRFSGELLVAACAIGLAESGDGGYAWNYDDEGLHARYARAIAVGDDFVFMTVAHGPSGGDAALYRQPCDGSTGFERCDLPSFPDNIDTGSLDALGADVAFGTRDGEVFHSSDHGATWTKLADTLPSVTHLRFVQV